MRKLIAQTFVTLDGVMEAPEKWQFPNDLFDEAMGPYVFEAYGKADALLLGRVTYEGFAAYWPKQSDGDPFAKTINNVRKYVVSKTLRTLEWKNSTLLKGDVVEEVRTLKGQSGGDILIAGSAQLVSGLTPLGLIDEHQIVLHPVVVGRGKPLFKQGIDPTLFTLADTKTFGTGVVGLTYRYKGKAKLG
jgi:dihydrofolate reductase